MTGQLQQTSLLRLPEVQARTGLSRSAIYAGIANKTFPAPVSLGSRAVAWVDGDIQQWIVTRIAAARNQIPNPTLATEGGHV